MVQVPLRPGESCWARRAPRALHAATLMGAVAGCADLLDIPTHPRLADESAVAPIDTRSNATSEPGADGSEAEPLAMTPATEAASGPIPLGAAAAAGPPATAPDDGAPGADAGAPTPDDAGPTPGCVAPQRLGPDDRCYATVPTLLSWFNARRSCRSLGDGWDLAAIHDDRVNQFFAALLTSEAWIGATDLVTEGRWVWVADGVTFWIGSADAGAATDAGYVNWNQGEPNNLTNSDCARIQPGAASTWADLDCTALRSAVCAGPSR